MATITDMGINNKKVARNAAMLTLRAVISTLVGLYTSRVVLATLGVEDYGIYGVVGGIVSTMGFLNASMAGATSRFLTYEMGCGNHQRLSLVFSSSLMIHALIALIVAIVAETVGLWFLTHQLNIPSERMAAAHWIFQFSVLGMIVGFTQTPYSAAIVAHERMHIYAYIELLSATLKLLVVYLLTISHTDKLILYGALILAVSIAIAAIYRIYCVRQFDECHFHYAWDKDTLRSMLSFSGWDLYGNMCFTANYQGITFLINIFFGVIFNAAVSIAATINNTILALTTTILQAFRPQITKQYAQGQIEKMSHLMCRALRFTILAIAALAVPCALEAPYVLRLWLGQEPPYAALFLQWALALSLISVCTQVCNAAIHSTGNIKRISFLNGTLYLIVPFVTWVIYRLGGAVQSSYIVNAASYIFIAISTCLIIKRQIPAFHLHTYVRTLFSTLALVIIAIIPAWLFSHFIDSSFLRLIGVCLIYVGTLASVSWCLLFSKKERDWQINFIRSKVTSWK